MAVKTRRNFKELRDQVRKDPKRRQLVEAEVRALLAGEALAHVRGQRGVSQHKVASALNVTQANVSRIEHEEDVYLSTLRGYVEALGGKLELRAVFPDGEIPLT
jgi:predicted XRE-type DNA-binding protein